MGYAVSEKSSQETSKIDYSRAIVDYQTFYGLNITGQIICNCVKINIRILKFYIITVTLFLKAIIRLSLILRTLSQVSCTHYSCAIKIGNSPRNLSPREPLPVLSRWSPLSIDFMFWPIVTNLFFAQNQRCTIFLRLCYGRNSRSVISRWLRESRCHSKQEDDYRQKEEKKPP